MHGPPTAGQICAKMAARMYAGKSVLTRSRCLGEEVSILKEVAKQLVVYRRSTCVLLRCGCGKDCVIVFKSD